MILSNKKTSQYFYREVKGTFSFYGYQTFEVLFQDYKVS